MIDTIARRIGYRVRPAWIWLYEGGGQNGLVVGFANDGIAGVPGVLRVTVRDDAGRVLVSGGLDPGWPVPGKIRQARLPLPPGDGLEGAQGSVKGPELRRSKGTRHPDAGWACHQKSRRT